MISGTVEQGMYLISGFLQKGYKDVHLFLKLMSFLILGAFMPLIPGPNLAAASLSMFLGEKQINSVAVISFKDTTVFEGISEFLLERKKMSFLRCIP